MCVYKTLLSIAGSDSSGGAGIQADIKTGYAFGVYAMTVVTAVTAQNSTGVKRVEPVSPEMIRCQLETIGEDIEVDAVKLGMLPDCESALSVAMFLEKKGWRNIVIDPVMVSTSGQSLSAGPIGDIYRERLFPLSLLVTPNIPEVKFFTGIDIRSSVDRRKAAEMFIDDFGCQAVLIKGGHLISNGECTDTLFYREEESIKKKDFTHIHITSRNTHGTGCTLSTAIASSLADGKDIVEACETGIEYLLAAIMKGKDFIFGSSAGHGPLNHWVVM